MKELIDRAWKLRSGYPEWLQPELVADMIKRMVVHHKKHGSFAPWGVTPITGMSLHNFERFNKQNVYKTIYQTGPTWHHRWAKGIDPIAAREFNDMRLFGGRALNTVFGVGFNKEAEKEGIQAHPESIENYLNCYTGDGRVMVKWKQSVLEYATFCYGDCQQTPLVFPYDPEWVFGLGQMVRVAHKVRNGGSIPADYFLKQPDDVAHFMALFVRCSQCPNPYFEVQIHKKLTPMDVEEVITG